MISPSHQPARGGRHRRADRPLTRPAIGRLPTGSVAEARSPEPGPHGPCLAAAPGCRAARRRRPVRRRPAWPTCCWAARRDRGVLFLARRAAPAGLAGDAAVCRPPSPACRLTSRPGSRGSPDERRRHARHRPTAPRAGVPGGQRADRPRRRSRPRSRRPASSSAERSTSSARGSTSRPARRRAPPGPRTPPSRPTGRVRPLVIGGAVALVGAGGRSGVVAPEACAHRRRKR